MPKQHVGEQSFTGKLEGTEKGRAFVVLGFDPESVWGFRERYRVRGAINGRPVRGALEQFGRGYFLPLGPTYRRDAGLELGDPVSVVLALEGPQAESLAPDIAAALRAEPEAERFFGGLATFYRKKYLSWIDATKRSPDLRAKRIGEMVALMKDGVKERPR